MKILNKINLPYYILTLYYILINKKDIIDVFKFDYCKKKTMNTRLLRDDFIKVKNGFL